MIIQKVQLFGKNLLQAERSAKKLARSICVGIFIAFSPFVGFHTVMAIALCWLFSLNYPVTLSVQLVINNPFTIVPIYCCDYGFGRLVSSLCNINFGHYMPSACSYVIRPLCKLLGWSSDFVWTTFVGGNMLSVFLALVMYIPIKWIFNNMNNKAPDGSGEYL
jgi:uncharacterized protein (DUF2062 family)